MCLLFEDVWFEVLLIDIVKTNVSYQARKTNIAYVNNYSCLIA